MEMDHLNRYEWIDIADMLCVDDCVRDVVALMKVEREMREACCCGIRGHLVRSEERHWFNSLQEGTEWENEMGQASRYCGRPAFIHVNGTRAWWFNDEFHRDEIDPITKEHLPTIIRADGSREWLVNNAYHRIDISRGTSSDDSKGIHLPAIICKDGTREWWVNDKLHRVDVDPRTGSFGFLPAIIRANGECEWWVNGIEQER
jgi:hypothetical protein